MVKYACFVRWGTWDTESFVVNMERKVQSGSEKSARMINGCIFCGLWLLISPHLFCHLLWLLFLSPSVKWINTYSSGAKRSIYTRNNIWPQALEKSKNSSSAHADFWGLLLSYLTMWCLTGSSASNRVWKTAWEESEGCRGASRRRRHAAFAVSPALICRNGDKVTDLLHVLASGVHCCVIFDIFLSFPSLYFLHLQCVMLSLSEEIAFFFWCAPSFLWQLLHLMSEGGGVTSTYCAGCAEPSVRLHINVAATPALVAHFRVITRRIQTASPPK